MPSLEQFYDKNIKKLIESINESSYEPDFFEPDPEKRNFYIDPEEPLFHYNDEKRPNRDSDNIFIDPEEPLFHYSDSERKEEKHTSWSPTKFSGTDKAKCEKYLNVKNGNILVTNTLKKNSKFEVAVEECNFTIPMRTAYSKNRQFMAFVYDLEGNYIGQTEVKEPKWSHLKK